jgi:hypothetical protein
MTTRHLRTLTWALVAAAFFVTTAAGADPTDLAGQTFTDEAAIKAWAAKSFFGGATSQTFSRGGKELIVVDGMPTSGLLTSQFVFFGRSASADAYRVVLRTGVLQGDAKAKEDRGGVVVVANGKTLLLVPFELVGVVAPSRAPRGAAKAP